jgi:hypothetical protein
MTIPDGPKCCCSAVPTPKFSKVAAQAFADARKKVHLKRSTRNKVVECWDLLKDDLQGLGMDFFIQIFREYPHLKELFPFGPSCVTEADMRASKMLQHHALMAMQMLGNAAVSIVCRLMARVNERIKYHVECDDFLTHYFFLLSFPQ